MSQITRVPRGLQEYLGTQNQGANPSDLMQEIRPSIAMDRFYDVSKELHFYQAFSPASGEFSFIANIPENDIWLIKQVGFTYRFTGTTVGDQCKLGVNLINLPNSNGGVNAHPLAGFDLRYGGGTVETPIAMSVPDVVGWGGAGVQFVLTGIEAAGAFTVILKAFVTYVRLKY